MPFVPSPTEFLALALFCFLLDSAGAFGPSAAEDPDVSPPCPFQLSVRIPLPVRQKNGTLWDPFRGLLYPRWAHWKWTWQREGDPVVSHRGCPCSIGVPCLLKCCHLDGLSPMHCTHRDPVCPASLTDRNSSSDLFHFLFSEVEAFAVFWGYQSPAAGHPPEGYADTMVRTRTWGLEERFTRDRTGDPRVGYCVVPSSDRRLSAWFCDVAAAQSRMKKVEPPAVTKHYPYGRLAAIAVLFCALCVYAALPQLRNFHGKIVVSHLMSLFLGNTILAGAVLLWRKVGIQHCAYFGIGSQYFFLASFCWLNVMCVDIFIAFRTLGPIRNKKNRRSGKRFMLSSLYAWGFPAIISVVTAALEWIPGLPDIIIRPDFERICWFRDENFESRNLMLGGALQSFTGLIFTSEEKKGALLYFFGPIGVTLLVNVLLFVATSIKIFTLQKETAKWESRRSVVLFKRMRKTRKRFSLYLKLSLMMGIGRAIGLLFWILDHPTRLFVVTDVIEALQSVLIFITYVWKDEVIILFKKKISTLQQTTTSIDTTDDNG